VYALHGLHTSPSARQIEDQIAELEKSGARVRIVTAGNGPSRPPKENRWRAALWPGIEQYYPACLLGPRLRELLEADRPDVAFAYHFEALAALRGASVPVFGAVGDPSHLPGWYAWRAAPAWSMTYLSHSWSTLVSCVHLPRYMRALFAPCRATGAFAAHHAAWFRRIGVRGCEYLRTPLIDDAGPDCEAQRARLHTPGKTKTRILLVGHLKGTATLSGLYLFAREILPRLEAELGAANLDVRVVGGYEPPADLRALLDRPSVHMAGQVEPATEEFLRCDVLLVPTPIRLGIRIRILTGFATGSCIVAHTANSLGIPELIDGKNALLGRTGAELAAAVLRASTDGALRAQLRREARRTYEQYFSLETAGRLIVDELGQVAAAS
jgi:glycosyltransferase involved in cell wall biosynthesis